MHIVFITGKFYPDPSPTGKCTKDIVDIISEGNEISVICMQNSNQSFDGEKIENVLIYSLTSYIYEIRKKIINNKTFLRKIIGSIGYPILALISLFSFPSGMKWFSKRAYNKLIEIENNKHIDCIVSVSSPFAGVISAYKWKKKNQNVRFITITYDPYYETLVKNRNLLVRIFNTKKTINIEKNIYLLADRNLVADAVAYSKISYDLFPKHNTDVIHFILPKRIDSEVEKHDEIKMLYAGGFYRKIRNPETVLKVLLMVNSNFKLNLYVNDSCKEVVNKYIDASNQRITKNKMVAPNEIQYIMNSSNILIDIGNSIGGVLPSKTIEYISTGLPIIYFYSNNLIPDMLKKYPLCLFIDRDSLDLKDSANQVQDFLTKNNGKRLTESDIEELFIEYTKREVSLVVKKSIII